MRSPVTRIAPGVARLVLDRADKQQCRPAELDVGADAVLAVREDQPQLEGAQRSRHPRSTAFLAIEAVWVARRASRQPSSGTAKELSLRSEISGLNVPEIQERLAFSTERFDVKLENQGLKFSDTGT
jgi:hypothetical protein